MFLVEMIKKKERDCMCMNPLNRHEKKILKIDKFNLY